jgi:hypothetical protein
VKFRHTVCIPSSHLFLQTFILVFVSCFICCLEIIIKLKVSLFSQEDLAPLIETARCLQIKGTVPLTSHGVPMVISNGNLQRCRYISSYQFFNISFSLWGRTIFIVLLKKQ